MWIRVYPNWRMDFNSKNGGKRCFSCETKTSISFIPTRECVCGAQPWKRKRLFYKSVVVQINERTLILKMAERDVFRTKPKHEYQLSQYGECIYDA